MLALVLTLVMAISMFGCGTSTSENKETTAGETTAAATSAETQQTESAAVEAGIYTPGEYTASAKGKNGDVKVSVTFTANEITAVEILEQVETVGVADTALEQIPEAIVASQSLGIDSIAGATITSDAILAAVADCVAQAGGDVEALKNVGVEKAEIAPIPESTDILVIGGGMAGMVSAITAADLGAHVVVVEQLGIIGGGTLTAGGYIHATGAKMQIEAGIEDSVELMLEDFQRIGGEGNNDPELARVYAENSAEAIDWLDEVIGVDFGDRVPGYGAYVPTNVARVFIPPRGGVEYIDKLSIPFYKYIEEGQIELFLNTEGTELIADENQKVTGAVVKSADGETHEIQAKATILATGGYGQNEEWLKKYHFTNIVSNTFAGATGVGYEMCTALGADLASFDFCQCYGGAVPVDGFHYALEVSIYSYPGTIWVDKNGDRIANEMTTVTTERNNAWGNAEENIVYVVFQEDQLTKEGSIFKSGETGEAQTEKLNDLIEQGFAFRADTIEELAELTGMENLPATVERYNGFAEAGKDEDFGRTEGMVALTDGPFYAIYTVPYILATRAGVRCNTDLQPVRVDGTAIEGVYLSGEIIGAANTVGYNNYGGSGLGLCAIFGRRAAKIAVESIK